MSEKKPEKTIKRLDAEAIRMIRESMVELGILEHEVSRLEHTLHFNERNPVKLERLIRARVNRDNKQSQLHFDLRRLAPALLDAAEELNKREARGPEAISLTPQDLSAWQNEVELLRAELVKAKKTIERLRPGGERS